MLAPPTEPRSPVAGPPIGPEMLPPGNTGMPGMDSAAVDVDVCLAAATLEFAEVEGSPSSKMPAMESRSVSRL